MLNFAHRGFSGRYLENTMESFRQAADVGATGIELDVQLSADGIPFIFHDNSLQRLANINEQVTEKTWDELRTILLTDENSANSGYIPSLEEYLEWVRHTDLITNIEFKVDYEVETNLEEITIRMVENYNLTDRVIYSSFQVDSLQRAKAYACDIITGFLFDRESLSEIGLPYSLANIKQLFKVLNDLGINYVHPHHELLDNQFVDFAQKESLKINTWTVNTLKEMDRLLHLPLDGIMTNYPSQLKYKIYRAFPSVRYS